MKCSCCLTAADMMTFFMGKDKSFWAGLILFLSIFANVWTNIKVKNNLNYRVSLFYRYGQFMLLVFLINSFTDVLDLDATTVMFLWVIIALLTVSKRLSTNPQNQLND